MKGGVLVNESVWEDVRGVVGVWRLRLCFDEISCWSGLGLMLLASGWAGGGKTVGT